MRILSVFDPDTPKSRHPTPYVNTIRKLAGEMKVTALYTADQKGRQEHLSEDARHMSAAHNLARTKAWHVRLEKQEFIHFKSAGRLTGKHACDAIDSQSFAVHNHSHRTL
jgi:hypothetical protein